MNITFWNKDIKWAKTEQTNLILYVDIGEVVPLKINCYMNKKQQIRYYEGQSWDRDQIYFVYLE